jgi:hypothetical protein
MKGPVSRWSSDVRKERPYFPPNPLRPHLLVKPIYVEEWSVEVVNVWASGHW